MKKQLEKFQAEQSGAIILVLMASFLILFMISLVLYDTGRAAEDKLKAQVSADVSSFSHSVIKSRTMNMLTYANTIKRMFYSYAVSYTNGFLALLGTVAYHSSRCFRLIPDPRSCYQLARHSIMIISETLESPFDIIELGLIPLVNSGRTTSEVESLERYQQYMTSVTPWWAWSENILRSFDSGALVTASWPPPSGAISNFQSQVSSIAGNIDWLTQALPGLGTTNLQGMLPSHTEAVDGLPVARRDRIVEWSTAAGPFNYSIQRGVIAASLQYCLEWVGSFEMLITSAQVVMESNNFSGFKPAFAASQLLGGLGGCLIVNIAWYSTIRSAHLDWKLNDEEYENPNEWLKSTSNMTYSYVPRASRMAEDRERYRYVRQDYANPRGASGYFALSRSELVYKPAQGARNDIVSSISGGLNDIPVVGGLFSSRLGLQREPDMWSPRWTARNRAVALPGERLGAASLNQDAGLNSVINDTIPYLVIAAGIVGGLGGGDNFGFQAGISDIIYLFRSVGSFGPGQIGGVAK